MADIKHKRIELPDLPYSYTALAPVISKGALMTHHSKHHLSYVTGVNAAMDKLEKMRAGEGLEINYKATMRDLSFHMAGNKLHSIFWKNMKKAKSNNSPKGDLLAKSTNSLVALRRFRSSSQVQPNQSRVQVGQY